MWRNCACACVTCRKYVLCKSVMAVCLWPPWWWATTLLMTSWKHSSEEVVDLPPTWSRHSRQRVCCHHNSHIRAVCHQGYSSTPQKVRAAVLQVSEIIALLSKSFFPHSFFFFGICPATEDVFCTEFNFAQSWVQANLVKLWAYLANQSTGKHWRGVHLICSVFYSTFALVLVPGLVSLLRTHAQLMLSSVLFSFSLSLILQLQVQSQFPASCVSVCMPRTDTILSVFVLLHLSPTGCCRLRLLFILQWSALLVYCWCQEVTIHTKREFEAQFITCNMHEVFFVLLSMW